jgi:hypothetical protein
VFAGLHLLGALHLNLLDQVLAVHHLPLVACLHPNLLNLPRVVDPVAFLPLEALLHLKLVLALLLEGLEEHQLLQSDFVQNF